METNLPSHPYFLVNDHTAKHKIDLLSCIGKSFHLNKCLISAFKVWVYRFRFLYVEKQSVKSTFEKVKDIFSWKQHFVENDII